MLRLFMIILTYCALSPRALAFDMKAVDLEAIDLKTDEDQRNREEVRDGMNIYRHNQNYFISGEPDTKIQFSFKLQFIHNWDLYFGYTQQMFWELDKDSSPFSDINYNPEIFYRWYTSNGMLKGIDFSPLEHRSNGRDGAESRSWNRAYINVRTEFKIGAYDSKWETKIFHLYDLDRTNRDMDARLGNIETSLTIYNLLPFAPEDELQIKIAPGGKLDLQHMQGYQEIGFRFRLPIHRFNPFIYMQIYNGVSESLLYYTSNHTSYRIGLAL